MKQIFLLALVLLCLKGFSQTLNEERPLGIIVSQNTWTSLAGWTVNGGTWTASGGKLHCNTGAGTFTQSLDYTAWGASCLPNRHYYVRFSVATVGGASYGLGAGSRSVNTYQPTDLVARLTTYTGGGNSILNLGDAHTQSDISPTALTISSGDLVEQTTDLDGYYLTTTVRNVTTNSLPITRSFLYQTFPNANPYMPNTGYWSIFAFGGNITVDSVCFSSSTPVNAALAVGGDSKVAGYDVTSQGYRISDQVGKVLRSTINLGGGYDRTIDMSARCAEAIKLHSKVFLNLIGSNDVRTSVSAATYEARFDSINNALTAAGIRVLVGVLYESSVDMSVLQNYLYTHYPLANIINLYDAMHIAGTLDAGNVHPNNYGDSVAAATILQFFGFFNQTPRYSPNEGAAYNWKSPHTWNLGAQQAIPINVLNFSPANNSAQFGRLGFQSVALNNGFIQENVSYNGSQSAYIDAGFGTVFQMSAGDFLFKTAISGSAGASATLVTKMAIKNNGNILFKSGTDNGNGDVQITGGQGLYLYNDPTHYAGLAPSAAGHLLINSSGGFIGISTATPTTELTVGANRTGANNGAGGLKLFLKGATFTDNSTAANGTVTNMAVNVIDADSLGASNNNVTDDSVATLAINGAPKLTAANTGATVITNPFAFRVKKDNSLFGGLALYASNYGLSYTSRTLTDKNYVDSCIAALLSHAHTWIAAQDMTATTLTVATQTPGDNSNKAASTGFVAAAVATAARGNVTAIADADYTVASNVESIIYWPAITANRTVTLPSAASFTNRHIRIWFEGGNGGGGWGLTFASSSNIILTGSSAATTQVTNITNALADFQSDGTTWICTGFTH